MIDIICFAGVSALGMFVQSLVGFGGALFTMPLMVLFLAPEAAVPAFCLVMLVVDVLLVVEARAHLNVGRASRLACGGVLGVPLGAWALTVLPTHAVGLLISALTLLFALLFLARVRVRLGENAPAQVGVGFVSGLLGGVIGQAGPPVVIYGLSREWPKDVFRTTLLSYFFVLVVVAAVSYACLGLIDGWTLRAAGVAVGPAVLAGWLGLQLKRRLAERHFRAVVLGVVIFVSLLGLARHALRMI
jgi:uncharacterized membrane protein YfcA